MQRRRRWRNEGATRTRAVLPVWAADANACWWRHDDIQTVTCMPAVFYPTSDMVTMTFWRYNVDGNLLPTCSTCHCYRISTYLTSTGDTCWLLTKRSVAMRGVRLLPVSVPTFSLAICRAVSTRIRLFYACLHSVVQCQLPLFSPMVIFSSCVYSVVFLTLYVFVDDLRWYDT